MTAVNASTELSINNLFLDLSLLFVAVSQWGIKSKTTWDAIAIGIARAGLPIFAAITVPTIAWDVAVIQ